MELRRWGANRNTGYTSVFKKKPNITWRASTNELELEVRRVSQGDQGQYNFKVLLTAEDIQELLVGLSKEAALGDMANVMRPVLRELFRLQLAAAGVAPTQD